MNIPYAYSDRSFLLTPYNTAQEKDVLLYASLCTPTIDGVLKIFEDNIIGDTSVLSTDEKKSLLYKMRSISVGDEVDIKFICDCGTPNETSITIPTIENAPQELIFDKGIRIELRPLIGEVTDDTLQGFVKSDIDVDDLDLETYNALMEHAQTYTIIPSLFSEARCFSCNHTVVFNIGEDQFVIDGMSEDSLMNIYKTTADLVFTGKYTKQDVDTMYPFERSIFTGILHQTLQEANS